MLCEAPTSGVFDRNLPHSGEPDHHSHMPQGLLGVDGGKGAGGDESLQPPQGLLAIQNGQLEETLANSRSHDHKLATHKPAAILNVEKTLGMRL